MNFSDLTAAERDILYSLAALERNAPPHTTELQAHYEQHAGPVSRHHVSTRLSKLQEAGLITARKDSDDARVVRYRLTPDGQELLLGALRERHSWLAAPLAESNPPAIAADGGVPRLP